MSSGKRYGLLAVVALSTPLALVVETGLRSLIMPPEFEDVRRWLRSDVTPWAWAMAPAAVVATGLGFVLQRRLLGRALRIPKRPGMTEAAARERAELDALMLSTSAPQVPALVATLAFMVGAELLPVLVTVGVATVGVLSLGLTVGRGPHQQSPEPGSSV